MDENFPDDEKLYRAVYPPNLRELFWKEDGTLSSAAFLDKNGLSVERGDGCPDCDVAEAMKKRFTGRIVFVSVGDCRSASAIVLYKPSKISIYHSEIHGSPDNPCLSAGQRRSLAKQATVLAD